jgi:hypothetical protein
MSSRHWLAAATLMALAIPAAEAGDRSRVQVTIAPYWGWDGPVHPRAVPRPYARGYRDGLRDGRYGGFGRFDGFGGFHPGGPAVRFDYTWRDRDRWYRPDGWRPGGPLRYDGRRDRHFGRDWGSRDWQRDDPRRDWGSRGWDHRARDHRDGDRRDWNRGDRNRRDQDRRDRNRDGWNGPGAGRDGGRDGWEGRGPGRDRGWRDD